MKIIKSTGEVAEFDPEKIRATLSRAGATKELIERIMARVLGKVRDGMSTRKLFAIIRKALKKESSTVAHRYRLRDALLKLGPAGFKFEKYIASILTAYGYQTELPEKEINGLCVWHEVDVVARKNGRTVVIEAKFRNSFAESVNLKDTMATWARYLDLCDGFKAGKCQRFDELWIMTNGRFSERALIFGKCKGIKMIGWTTKDESMAKLVDHAALYPLTVLDDLKQWELDKFAAADIMLCREITGRDTAQIAQKTGLPAGRISEIAKVCGEVVGR